MITSGIIRAFWADASGATAVEYAIMAGLIAAVIAAAVGVLGLKLDAIFSDPGLHSALS
jgi:pilus assembly protein Flp/PilA